MLPLEQIHPFVIHFPIAFFLSLFLLDLYAWAKRIPLDGRGGMANLSAGLALVAGIGATIAAIFGSLALGVATSSGVPEALTEPHETLGGITASAFAIWGLVRIFVWWRKFALGKGIIAGIILVELALSILIVITAFYGGQLVYEFGVNVAPPAG